MDIVAQHDHWKRSPAEIVEQFPTITLADVYAALAYYHDHQEEIRGHLQEDDTFVEAFQQQHPEKIVQLHDPHAAADPLSP